MKQAELPFISRDLEHNPVNQRIADGYINATEVCTACGKLFADYLRLSSSHAFIDALSSDMGIPISELIQSVKGGPPKYQGTWVHPQVAINVAQWASPKFAVQVSKWVFEWMNAAPVSRLPYHIDRYLLNRGSIPPTHFSIFNEIMLGLIAPLEDQGYELPDKLVPDISEGRMFAAWVREEKGLEPNDFPTYKHRYPDGRVIPGVKLYPNELLADFRDHFYNVWLKTRASKYFGERDLAALPYLQKMIASLPSAGNNRRIA